MRLLDTRMILQGVEQTIQPLGVGYVNRLGKDPNGGGMWRFPTYTGPPSFDLPTSARYFQVSLHSVHNNNFGAFGEPLARAP